MVGYTKTSRVGRKEGNVVGSSAKAMSRSLSALANRHRAREAGDSSTNRPGRKGVFSKGGTETKESTGGDIMTETVVNDWISKMEKPWEGTSDRIFCDSKLLGTDFTFTHKLDFAHDFYYGGSRYIGAHGCAYQKGTGTASERKSGGGSIGISMFFPQIEIDPAGKQSSQGCVHHIDGDIIRIGVGCADMPDSKHRL